VHLHPRVEKKPFRRNLQGKFVSAPPDKSKSEFFSTFLLGGSRFGGSEWFILVLLACVLRATTKKIFDFFEE